MSYFLDETVRRFGLAFERFFSEFPGGCLNGESEACVLLNPHAPLMIDVSFISQGLTRHAIDKALVYKWV